MCHFLALMRTSHESEETTYKPRAFSLIRIYDGIDTSNTRYFETHDRITLVAVPASLVLDDDELRKLKTHAS